MQVLRTERLVLRPYQPTLRDSFLAWMEEAAIEAFLSRSFPDLPKGDLLFDSFVHRCSATQPAARAWAVTEASDGRLVAHIECKTTAKTSGDELELIYVVRREFEGRGVATEAVTAITAELATAGVAVLAFINPANGASRRVLQKAGFVQTGDAATGQQGERWIHAVQRAVATKP